MSLSPKDLKRLADACRKAGITHYKDADVEFTLSDEAPPSAKRKSTLGEANRPSISDSVDASYTSDELTEEQLLMWSSGEDLETM